MQIAEEKRREKAKQLRYKKPITKDLNLDTIKEELWDIQGECENVRWYFDTDDDTLINALDGDEDEAYEFRMMFTDLCAECERMAYDLDEEWVPDCFDRFFVAIGAGEDYGGLLGFDTYEQDYFGLSCADVFAEDESKKALKQMTKDDLIVAARQCFRVYHSYMALRHRYDCLKASLDILRAQNTGYLQMVKHIEEVYDKADQESCSFKYGYCKEVLELDRILNNLPQEAWIQ
ncbi:MAG TPA: hypothetical protein DDY31_01555 [Lachnospiraceae bacterium]|nr:hypothetical protein [Lachnospiraceae bacterium]